MTMPDGNSAAESRHAHETAKREELAEDFCEKALEDLVERMMNGEAYPRNASNGYDQITMFDILLECNQSELSGAVKDSILMGMVLGSYELYYRCLKIVRERLRDSKWHERRIAEMIEEARDEQE